MKCIAWFQDYFCRRNSLSNQMIMYIRIITTVGRPGALYHFEWIFPDQSITQDMGTSSVMPKIWKYPQDVIQCVRSSYCIGNLFIIYISLKKKFHFYSICLRHDMIKRSGFPSVPPSINICDHPGVVSTLLFGSV